MVASFDMRTFPTFFDRWFDAIPLGGKEEARRHINIFKNNFHGYSGDEV
jgi:hypothetical protein